VEAWRAKASAVVKADARVDGAGVEMDVAVDAIASVAENGVAAAWIAAVRAIAAASVAAENVAAVIGARGIVVGWRDRGAADGTVAGVRCSRRICRRSAIC
jgi:hypothetical protein